MSTFRVASAVVATAAAVVAPTLSASAATTTPRPPVRTLTSAATSLGCTFRPVDTVPGALDSVAAPATGTVVLAGRAPAGGAHTWAVTPYGTLSSAFTAPEAAAVRLDTATDGSTILAGTTGIARFANSRWTKVALPAGVKGAGSAAALPAGGAAVLGSTGRVLTYSAGAWRTSPALPGRTIKVGAAGATPLAATVEASGTAQRVRTWALTGGRWTQKSTTTVSGLPGLTVLNTKWASAAAGGTLAVNSATGLAGIVDLTTHTRLATTSIGVKTRVTAARTLPDGRVLLGHAAPAAAGKPAAGALSIVAAGRSAQVPGSAGAPVSALAISPATASTPVIVAARTTTTDGAVSSDVATCR